MRKNEAVEFIQNFKKHAVACVRACWRHEVAVVVFVKLLHADSLVNATEQVAGVLFILEQRPEFNLLSR